MMNRTVAAIVVIGTLAVSACASPGGSDEQVDDPMGGAAPTARITTRPIDLELVRSLDRFVTCDAFDTWVDDELQPRLDARGTPPVGWSDEESGAEVPELDAGGGRVGPADSMGVPDVDVGDGAVPPAAPQDAQGGGATADGEPPEYSETNVQVAGIDEPDLVKTDGRRIVALVDGRLHLVAAEDRKVLDTLDLPSHLYGQEMVMYEDRVVVLGTANGPYGPPRATVAQVDIDDDHLTLTTSFMLDGTYISARRIDNVLRLVLHDAGDLWPTQPRDEGAENLLPRWQELDDRGDVVDDGPLLDCEQVHGPEDFAGLGMVTVATVNLEDDLGTGITSARGAAVMADVQTVYASHNYLYVAAPEWVEAEWLHGGVLDSEEWPGRWDQRIGTDIHRFDISDPEEAVYDKSGSVEGELLNQFALDEHDGYLRVATTSGIPGTTGADGSESHVFVLAPGDGVLTQVGSVSGLGPGESIHAVRLMGDIGYVVTFDETDPLYTVDLSDPTDPREVGELKILGYSAYLHPVGQGWLLGVGQDGTETGRLLGTQVSLFDVRDPSDPRRVAQATVSDAQSSAEWDHRAFLWWQPTELAAIPVGGATDEGRTEGLVGFTVDIDDQTITEHGWVTHPDLNGSGPVGEPLLPIVRSLIIGDDLWTLSGTGLAVTNVDSFDPETFVAWPR